MLFRNYFPALDLKRGTVVRKKIVIAEDDKGLRDLLQYVLEEEGFEVSTVPHGQAAIELLASLRDSNKLPNMIILDLNMPMVTGWQVASWLEADPRLDEIPVIVISATEAHGRAAKMLNADAYLVKPFSTDEIIGIVGLFSLFS